MKHYFLSVLFFLVLALSAANAQSALFLKILAAEADKSTEKLLGIPVKAYPDSLSAIATLNNRIRLLREKSFLAAAADSIWREGDTLFALIDAGSPFYWARLRPGNVDEAFLIKSGFKEKFFNGNTFSISEFTALEQRILRYSENHGYPFAMIRLDSINVNGHSIEGALDYHKGPQIHFDTLQIIGNTKVKSRFLSRHLRIIEGQPFSQEKVEQIVRRIKELPYLRQTRSPVITFMDNKALVTLFLDDRRSNQMDGIIGFLPNEGNDNKLLVTGELNMNLRNLFGTGKNLQAEWRKMRPLSQMLNLAYAQPKLFGSSLDLGLTFNLLRQDSLFINVDKGMLLSHHIGKYGKVHFSTGIRTSRQLSLPQAKDTLRLLFADFDHRTYGLGYEWHNLDDFFFPHRGWHMFAGAQIGNKVIRRNPLFRESLYEGVELRSAQMNFNLSVFRYIPAGKKSVFVWRAEGGRLINDQRNLFYNDLYRVGGLRTLRGFNENHFFASSFAIGSVEYRLFTEETSYLLLFFDQGFIRNELDENFIDDLPFGIGAGISFTTAAGVFNFIYSLGNSRDQKLGFNHSRIHFGLVSRF